MDRGFTIDVVKTKSIKLKLTKELKLRRNNGKLAKAGWTFCTRTVWNSRILMSGVVVGGGHMSSHMIRVILPTLCLQQWQQSAAHCYVTCECSDSWIDNIQPVLLYCTELTTHTTLSVLSFNIIIVHSKTKLMLKWPSVISDCGFQIQSWYFVRPPSVLYV